MATDMATENTADEVKSRVFEWLKGTRYESTSLEPLSGGSMNFIYKAHLSEPLEDGTTDVLVKHGEDYSAANSANKVTIDRCVRNWPLLVHIHPLADNWKRIEEECLNALASFRISPDEAGVFNYVVRTPKCYLYDDATHTQIQEYLPNGINLKTYAFQHFPSPTPESLRPRCHQLGRELAQWITGFHRKPENKVQLKLFAELKGNKEMQSLKHMINYDWLLQRIDRFPDILTRSRETFVKVKEQALDELQRNPEDLKTIHADFWTGK
jgi:hypothetical protein